MNATRLRVIFWTGILFLAACTAPLPDPTPEPQREATSAPTPTATAPPRPTATALPTGTPRPTATAAPAPTISPTPSAGYYRHAELGFWFHFPVDWTTETTGASLPSVIIRDPDDPVILLAGGRVLEASTDLAAFAAGVKDELGLAPQVDLVADEPLTLANGNLAHRISLSWVDGDGEALWGEGYVFGAGDKGYLLLMIGRPEVISARPETIAAIAASLTFEEPELFGVSRANALVILADEPTTLDPIHSPAGPGGLVAQVFSGLVRLNAAMQIEPDLAERWELSDDGTTYTFYLRHDVVFHDGRRLTAADVLAAWERATDPAQDSLTARLYLSDIVGAPARLAGDGAAPLRGVAVVDDHTLTVTIDGAKPYFLAKLAQPVAFITNPANVASGETWWRRPAGTGPFAVTSWRDGQAMVMRRDPGYYNTPPSVSALIYIFGSAGVPLYEAGLIDVGPVNPRNLARARDPGERLSADLVSGSLMCTGRISFDMTRPPFDNPDIRRAFSLAVDRQQLAQVVLYGAAGPATGLLPPAMPGFVDRPLAETFAPDAARALLDAAGPLPPITFTIPGVGAPDALTTALVDGWNSRLGADVTIELVDPALYDQLMAAAPGNLFVQDWCAGYPDPENILDLYYHTAGPGNFSGYSSADVDAQLEAARVEADPAARLALYQAVEAQLLADSAAIATVFPLAHVLVRPYVQGFILTPIVVNWPAAVTIEREENS